LYHRHPSIRTAKDGDEDGGVKIAKFMLGWLKFAHDRRGNAEHEPQLEASRLDLF